MIGPRNDPKADFSMFSGSRGWILDPWGGRVNARNEKNPPRGGSSSEALGGSTPWTSGNRFGGTVLPKHPQVCVMKARVSSKIPSKPCYRWPQPLALWRVSRDWDQELLPWESLRSGRTGRLCTRPNRAAAHPSTDTRTGRHEKTGQKVPESHQELSDRDGVVSGGGALSGEQRAAARRKRNASSIVRSWSRNPKFDTRLPVSKAEEGAALPKGQGLGAFLSRLCAHRKPLGRTLGEVGNCRTEGRPSGACPCGQGSCHGGFMVSIHNKQRNKQTN